MGCSEQKAFAVMRRIIQNFRKDGGMVLNQCMGTNATAKACFQETKHLNCIGFDSEGKCFTKTMQCLLGTFPRHVLCEESDVPEGEGFMMAAEAYLNMLSSSRSARSRNTWTTPTDLPPMHFILPHAKQFLLLSIHGMKLFEKAKHNFCTLW